MSRLARLSSLARRRCGYANVAATLAMFIALGGGAYAATALPGNSVGRAQLRWHAVTAAKLADRAVRTRTIARNAVRFDRLSAGVRWRLSRRARRGPAGPPGPKGDTGPRGPAGANATGATAIHYDAPAEPTPAPTTVLAIPGLRLTATCTSSAGDVTISLSALATEDATLQASVAIDAGANPADPAEPHPAQTGNVQQTLTGGEATPPGGPSTSGGTGYVRIIATGILVSASHTITLNLLELANANSQRCQLAGTALPAT